MTSLGGRAFGNDPAWILAAMQRALRLVRDVGLDVRIVTRGAPTAGMRQLVAHFA
ncbi:MAG: hypothetical protein R2712_25425 [Vicinamibacterales bacterium]